MLEPGGAFVAKVLAGGTDAELLALLKRHFRTVKHAKPPASRKGSSEWYVVAQGFKGGASAPATRCRFRVRGFAGHRLRLRRGAGGVLAIGRGTRRAGPGAGVGGGPRRPCPTSAAGADAAGRGTSGPPPCCLR